MRSSPFGLLDLNDCAKMLATKEVTTQCGLQMEAEIGANVASFFAPLGRLLHVGMKRIYLLAACLLYLVGCPRAKDKWPSEGTFQGTHVSAFESSWFQPDGSDEYWWLSGNLETLP